MRPEAEQEYTEYLKSRMSRLHHTAYLLCGDSHAAQDIVQATAIAVYLNWKRVQEVENIDGFVHRILVRKYLDQKRLSWAKVVVTDRLPERETSTHGLDLTERDAIMSALATLGKGQRAVIVLRYFCDLSVEATAAVLGCSTGNVKSQTARGLASLRGILSHPRVTPGSGRA